MSAAAPALPIPGSDQYASAEVMANNAYNSALAQLNQNRLNTLTSYGYTGNVDPTTGVLNGVRVDTHSMDGQLQQLLHGSALEDQNAQFAAEDRGLHGGLGNQIADSGRYQHGVDATGLGAGLEGQLSDFQQQQQGDAEQRDNALWQAQQQALDAELQSEQSDSLTQLLTGGYGDGSTKSKPSTTPNNPGGPNKPAKTGHAAKQKALRRIIRSNRSPRQQHSRGRHR